MMLRQLLVGAFFFGSLTRWRGVPQDVQIGLTQRREGAKFWFEYFLCASAPLREIHLPVIHMTYTQRSQSRPPLMLVKGRLG